MMIGKDLSRILREGIRASGMTRAELTRRSGLHYSAVHGFVGSDRDLTLRSATKLLRALGLEATLRPVRRRKRRT